MKPGVMYDIPGTADQHNDVKVQSSSSANPVMDFISIGNAAMPAKAEVDAAFSLWYNIQI